MSGESKKYCIFPSLPAQLFPVWQFTVFVNALKNVYNFGFLLQKGNGLYCMWDVTISCNLYIYLHQCAFLLLFLCTSFIFFRYLVKLLLSMEHMSTGTTTSRHSHRLFCCYSGSAATLSLCSFAFLVLCLALKNTSTLFIFMFIYILVIVVKWSKHTIEMMKHWCPTDIWCLCCLDVLQGKHGMKWCWHACMGKNVIQNLTTYLEKSSPVAQILPSFTSWASTCFVPFW